MDHAAPGSLHPGGSHRSKDEPEDINSETSPRAQRDFVARLLLTIAAANPAVIVLDMFYPRDNCSTESSAPLLSPMRKVSAQLRVVLLTNDNTPDKLQSSDPERLQMLET